MVPPLLGLRHRMDEATLVALLRQGRGAMPPAPPAVLDHVQVLTDFLLRRNRPAAGRVADDGRPSYYIDGFGFLNDPDGYPGVKPPWGQLTCIDLNTGKISWHVPLGEYPELTRQGVPLTGTENFGGPTVTAGGLVFCAGTRDRRIRAFDVDTGRELWSAQLPWGGYAPPAVYEAAGRQFVVIAASGGGKLNDETGDAYVAFALP
jgi:quinoprotein glucose dehydrogenase